MTKLLLTFITHTKSVAIKELNGASLHKDNSVSGNSLTKGEDVSANRGALLGLVFSSYSSTSKSDQSISLVSDISIHTGLSSS